MSHLTHTQKIEHFAGEVVVDQEGKRRFRLNSDRYFQHFLNTKTKVGEKWTMILSSHKPKRTEQQNRYYWGAYLPLIGAETGEEDLERLHELFKGMFLTKCIAEVLGQKVRMTKSTTDLSVSEFSDYIMRIEEFTGIQAPPTENYDLAPLTPVRREKITA